MESLFRDKERSNVRKVRLCSSGLGAANGGARIGPGGGLELMDTGGRVLGVAKVGTATLVFEFDTVILGGQTC